MIKFLALLTLFQTSIILAGKTCKNGGILYVSKGIEYCICHKNYAGDECELELDKLSVDEKKRLGCSLRPCWFGATCEDLTHVGGTFKCHCSAVSFRFLTYLETHLI